ncbi:MAG: hypothetical protein VYE15_04615 [Myxococcota bacterium]|nr:hypothetical protein [Myxococcota bacterium]
MISRLTPQMVTLTAMFTALTLLSGLGPARGQVVIRDEDGATRMPVSSGELSGRLREVADEPPPPRLVPEQATKMVASGHMRYVTLPNFLIDQFTEVHPDYNSMAGGVSLAWPMGDGHRLVVELDVTGLSFDPGNWLGKGADGPTDARYVEMGLTMIAADASYRRHLWLTERVAIVMGGGLGLAAVLGSFTNTEVLPTCLDSATCAHWGEVGRTENSLPTPVVPVLHLMSGVHVEIAQGISARVEAGLKNVLYMGAAVGYAF